MIVVEADCIVVPVDEVYLVLRSMGKVNVVIAAVDEVDLVLGSADKVDLILLILDKIDLIVEAVDEVDSLLRRRLWQGERELSRLSLASRAGTLSCNCSSSVRRAEERSCLFPARRAAML